jgi:hypothetical protein
MRSNLGVLLLLAACSSEATDPGEGPPDTGVATPDAEGPDVDAPLPGSPDAAVDPPPPEGEPRVVAIGDLHGDFASALEAFQVGGLVDAQGDWIGGNAWVVQVGDQLDRGDTEKEILDFLDELMVQAEAAGGKVIVLNGNHELMNVAGDFGTTTEGGFADFGGIYGRWMAFWPGAAYAVRLSKRPLYAIAGGTVFAHGGIRPEYVRDLDAIEQSVRAWMRGEAGEPALLHDLQGIVYTRDFSKEETAGACYDAEATLAALGVERMVVAHTVQYNGINSICAGQVWRIDVGLSDFFNSLGAPKTQVLEIKDGETRILIKE